MPGKRLLMRLLRRLVFPVLVILWIWLVLYPNPANLVFSVQRIFDPNVDPEAAAPLAAQMPPDPEAIEEAVLEIVPYSYDWQTYGMPWYCPTVEQILDKGKGDCKARALLLASLLEAKGIPYTLNYSPVHVWVHYESKQPTVSENDQVSFYTQDPETGERSWHMPSIPFRAIWDEFCDDLWWPMPVARKVLLFIGLILLVWLRIRHWNWVKGVS